jgi:hypothetical protein
MKIYAASHATSANVTQFVNAGSTSLSIASSGAATFSSSVASASNFSVARNGSNTVQAGYILETISGTLYLSNFQLDTSGGLNTWTYNPTNGWQNRMTLTTGGNVGIGTSSPVALTEIKSGDITNGGTAKFTLALRSGTTTYFDIYQGYNSTIAGQSMFGTTLQSGDALGFATSNIERMRITSGGNVIIGDSTDAGGGYKLQVYGGNIRIRTTVNGVNGLLSFTNSSGTVVSNIYNYNGLLSLNDQLTIANSGGAAIFSSTIAATSATFSGGATFFNGGNTFVFSTNVLTSGNADGAQIRNVISTAANPTYAYSGDTDTGMYSDAANTLSFSTGGTNRLTIASTGAATFTSSVTATSFFESSSIKGKDIIATNPLLALDIDVIKYTRKSDESKDIRYGYSAEQIHSLMPELTDKDVTAVKYLDVHTILISQLQKEIKELKAKLN